MVLMNKRRFKLITILAGLSLFAYAYYLQQQSKQNRPDYSFAKQILGEDTTPSESVSIPMEDNHLNPQTVFKPPISFGEFRELMDWDSSRGYFSEADLETYKSYDEQTLKDLSNRGDIRAMRVLADFYIHRDFRPEEAHALDYRATVYGATATIPLLAEKAHLEMLKSDAYKDSLRREQGVIEVLAYYKVGAFRGDLRASAPLIETYKARYRMFANEELAISPELLSKVDARAIQIYDELLQARRDLGLGDFDNSTPATVKDDYKNK
ncbi:MAG TPA: hypothetical protein VL995_07590 [Cellvibrio sp.]|nr:hypothetical protein [Cellvibrio sp.]